MKFIKYTEGYVYHIKDEYFVKVNDDKLMCNKENGQYRPTYFCIKDEKTSLLWVVPMSSQYEKYQKIAEKQIAKYGESLGIVLGEYDGKKAAFLIQNMFPITEKYLDHIHTRNGNSVPVKYSIQNTVKSHLQKARLLLSKGKKVVFPDVNKLEKIMIDEVIVSKPRSESCKTASINDKPKSDHQTVFEENEKRKEVIHTTNAILNENPELKRQFIEAKKKYLQKQDNLNKEKIVSSENTPKHKR